MVKDLPRANSTTRRNAIICDTPLYIVVTSEPIMKFQNVFCFMMCQGSLRFYQSLGFCASIIYIIYFLIQSLQTLFITGFVCDHAQYNLNESMLEITGKLAPPAFQWLQ